MQECYLALACLLKDEKYFIEIGEDDRVKFNDAMLKHIEKSSFLNGTYKEAKEKIEPAKERIKKEINSLNTKERTDAKTFYKKTSDEWQSDIIYLNYRYISNIYGHISHNSLSHHVIKTETGWATQLRGITASEIRSAVKYIIDTSIIFGNRIDSKFFSGKYNKNLEFIINELYQYYIKIGVIIHKNDLSEHI